jgi:hypothetical protein
MKPPIIIKLKIPAKTISRLNLPPFIVPLHIRVSSVN